MNHRNHREPETIPRILRSDDCIPDIDNCLRLIKSGNFKDFLAIWDEITSESIKRD